MLFVASDRFLNGIDFDTGISSITLELSGLMPWDRSAISAVDKVVTELRRNRVTLSVVAPEGEDGALLSRLAVV